MKKFRFSLQTVLDVRLLKEEVIQKEFSAILAEKSKTLSEIQRLKDAEEELREYQRSQRLSGEHKQAEEKWYGEKLADYQFQGLKQVNVLKEVENRLELKRQELIQAAKDRKVLERLKENQRLEYVKKADHEDQIFMDELAQNRDARATV